MSALIAPHFQNPEAARKMIEEIRWPEGPVCSHCGVINHAYAVKNRDGLYRCAEKECRKDFTCTTGTVMERSKIPLNKWMMAFYLMSASKKGMSAHQLHRALGVTYQSAWFLCHRIREAMRAGGFIPMGGDGGSGIVEADETYFGNVEEANRRQTRTDGSPFLKAGKRGGPANKRAIVALVERGGEIRSFHVAVADKESVNAIVSANIAKEARVFTDESRLYSDVAANFSDHKTVKHSVNEYSRHEKRMIDDQTFVVDKIHTNTIEGAFSIFKRGMKGIYQHCDEKHLHRYLAEFDFRYNHRVGLGHSDIDRTKAAIRGAEGKRLTYHQTH